MMNWGKKKPPSSSSTSHNHLISRVFPLSWLSKFKRKSEKMNSNSNKNKINSKENPPRYLQRVSSVRSPKNPIPTYYWDSNLYTQDNDGFWRLSSNKENTKGVNKDFVVPSNYCKNCKSNVKEIATKKTNQKNKVLNSEILNENGKLGSNEACKNESLQKTYNRIIEATKELHRELDEVNGYRKSIEKELSDFELEKEIQMMEISSFRKNPEVISRNQGDIHQNTSNENYTISEWQKLKDAKIKQVLVRNEKQRKSFHVKRESNKIKVSSPKTPLKMEICKVKALEDMKKARIKKKMKAIQVKDKSTNLGSFAVVKTSQDPQKDFRDSMIEMIIEKRITKSEELEELLACYLTLNASEYHDLIIKVFGQVWHELEEAEQVNQN